MKILNQPEIEAVSGGFLRVPLIVGLGIQTGFGIICAVGDVGSEYGINRSMMIGGVALSGAIRAVIDIDRDSEDYFSRIYTNAALYAGAGAIGYCIGDALVYSFNRWK